MASVMYRQAVVVPVPEPAASGAVGVTVAQVGERGQGLPAGVRPTPPTADRTAAFTQAGGEETKMRAGQVRSGRVDKHVKPLTERVVSVVNPSTRGFTRLSHQPPVWNSRWEEAPCIKRSTTPAVPGCPTAHCLTAPGTTVTGTTP